MQTLKRSIILQLFVFIGFSILGINTILIELINVSNINFYLALAYPVVIVIGIIVFFKTAKDDVIVINNVVMQRSKMALYGIAIGLLISFLKAFNYYLIYFVIASGSVTTVASLYGACSVYKALKN